MSTTAQQQTEEKQPLSFRLKNGIAAYRFRKHILDYQANYTRVFPLRRLSMVV